MMILKVGRNQNGVTLVELLAALAISMIIIGLVSTVFISSFSNYNKSLSKANLSQEANIVIAQLTKIHHKNLNYTLENDTSSQLIKIDTGSETWLIGESTFHYELTPTPVSVSRDTDYVELTLKVSDPNNKIKPFETTTIINRR